MFMIYTNMNSIICSLIPLITVIAALYPVVKDFSSVSEEMELNAGFDHGTHGFLRVEKNLW